jgi:hypothetical protein
MSLSESISLVSCLMDDVQYYFNEMGLTASSLKLSTI